MPIGYYRFPTIYNDTVAFVSEDDLWITTTVGGMASRLTTNLGTVTYPAFSPDGKYIAFLGREEGGEEIYLIPTSGGESRRLTFWGNRLSRLTGWTPDGKVAFCSNHGLPIMRWQHLFAVDLEGNPPQPLNFGPARALSFGPKGGVVIGRNVNDPRHWKRDRGGQMGSLWIDEKGEGNFHPLICLNGEAGSPMWIGESIYFLSDHEGISNLYSCLPSGEDLRRLTNHQVYFAYNATSDGRRIVYHSGSDLYLYDPSNNESRRLPVELHSARAQRNRKFVPAGDYLDGWKLNPVKNELAITTRGKAFSFPAWDGAVTQHGIPDGVRYRLLTWLADGERLIGLTDQEGEDRFVIFDKLGIKSAEIFPLLDVGRVNQILANPKHDSIVISNQRCELLLLDLSTKELHLIERDIKRSSRVDRWTTARGSIFDWSPDGEWLVYTHAVSMNRSHLRLWEVASRKSYDLTRPLLRDESPSFDPQGNYIYFISYRSFSPVPDNLHFENSFPRGMKPYLIPLRRDLSSPFTLTAGQTLPDQTQAGESLRIDLEGITERIIAFPVEEGQYGRIFGMQDGKVIYSRHPVEPLMDADWEYMPIPKATIYIYNLNAHEEKSLVQPADDFGVAADRQRLLYRLGSRLRIFNPAREPDPAVGDSPGVKSGWVDLSRVKVSVQPGLEWQQMLAEAWRLQRDLYWTASMSGVDWEEVYRRYMPLVERVGCRSELSALIWEMQTELGTGHAYEDGGDYRHPPAYHLGYLAADFLYEPARDGWLITHIVRGDPWEPRAHSPLAAAGININEGDIILLINGQRLSRSLSPEAALVNQAGCQVTLTLAGENSPRQETVKTLADEMPVRYREWVETNRRHVHDATHGRIGYLHIPDMEVIGYGEFHRGFLEEIDRDGLIVDARYNTGGFVSNLIWEKLARKRIGYVVTRHASLIDSYPPDTISGPMVALANEFSGSDGDLFSQSFKALGLGPLIGKRTWGGIIGISPRNPLVDGTITTQPENAYGFDNKGWSIENHGVEPDFEVENLPQDYKRGFDAQLERAIQEILKMLDNTPYPHPLPEPPPDRHLPKN